MHVAKRTQKALREAKMKLSRNKPVRKQYAEHCPVNKSVSVTILMSISVPTYISDLLSQGVRKRTLADMGICRR